MSFISLSVAGFGLVIKLFIRQYLSTVYFLLGKIKIMFRLVSLLLLKDIILQTYKAKVEEYSVS